MIFVALGTWEMPFPRPLYELEKALEKSIIKEEVIVQCGKTSFQSNYMKLVPFFNKEDLEKNYEQASMIICQAGVGSIMLGLSKRKKIISIARLSKYEEHIDDHQKEILHVFAVNKYILPWQGDGDLETVLHQSVGFIPVPYPFKEEEISDYIIRYIDETIKNK